MSRKPSNAIRARVLGDASITTSVTTIEPNAEILFAAALYLVLERKEPVSRRAIQALLWPDESSTVSAHRLRQTLLKLKKLGVPVTPVGKEHVGLNGTPVSIDYEEFLAAKKGAENGSADSLVMLPAYEPRFSSTYLEWLDSQKAEVNASLTRMMLGVIARHRVKGEWAQVEKNASRLLRFQPFNEEATLAMAEACAMRGAKLEATGILDRYLSEVGPGPTDLRVPATIMRRRIADRMQPRAQVSTQELPLFGRQHEIEQLVSLLQCAREKRGQGCLVLGDPGIGKSRLIAEFSTFACLQGVELQRFQCRPADVHRPLSAFVDLVPRLREMRGAIGCSAQTLRHLDRLTTHIATNQDTLEEPSAAEFRYAGIQQSLFDLVDAVSEECALLIVIEDVHWLDSISASLIRDMAEWGRERAIFFLLTTRYENSGSIDTSFGGFESISLAGLPAETSRDLLLSVVRSQGASIDDDYASWCVVVGDGNPYFLQQLATHWIETGEKQSVPPSLAVILEERLRRLHPQTLQVLQTCCVLEQNSTLTRIESMLQFPAHQMLSAINELGRAGMLTVNVDPISMADRLSPRHDLLAAAALAQLSAPALAFLHRKAASILEREISDDESAAILWDSAKHWREAGDTSHAFELAKTCATHLMELGLPRAATEAYQRTLTYCATADERFATLKQLARAQYSGDQWSETVETVAEVNKLAKLLAPKATRHDEFELMELRARWRSEVNNLPIADAIECLEATDASVDHRVAAGAAALMMSDQACDHGAMRRIYGGIENAWSIEPPDLVLRHRADMVYHSVCGDLAKGVNAARQLVEEQRKRGDPAELVTALCNAAASWRTAGLFGDAETALIEAFDIAERQGVGTSASTALLFLAQISLEIGNNSRARDLYETMVARAAKPEAERDQKRLVAVGARLAITEKRYAEARRVTRGWLRRLQRDPLADRRVYRAAVFVGARIVERGEDFFAGLSVLEDAFRRARVNSRQTFPAGVLYHALAVAGQSQKAEEILQEYLTKHRREPWMPSDDLLRQYVGFN